MASQPPIDSINHGSALRFGISPPHDEAACPDSGTLPAPRGPLSEHLIDALRLAPSQGFAPLADAPPDPLADNDLQLALYLCYELHYRGFAGVDAAWEWDPGLLGFRASLESAMLDSLEAAIGAPTPPPEPVSVEKQIFELIDGDDAPSLSRYVEITADLDEFREFVVHRSAYQLKEADPHSWAIPRLTGAAKAALVEVQADEYGGGDPERVHATLFARTMEALGLDPTYGAYLDQVPGTTLATVNLMSLFGLHRRWRGAIVGHLAGFEVSSPRPNSLYAKGLRRLGIGAPATEFFDEHVEADSVHENIAAYDLAGGLAAAEPALAGDILFGVRALLHCEGRFAEQLLSAWEQGQSSLLDGVAALDRW